MVLAHERPALTKKQKEMVHNKVRLELLIDSAGVGFFEKQRSLKGEEHMEELMSVANHRTDNMDCNMDGQGEFFFI